MNLVTVIVSSIPGLDNADSDLMKTGLAITKKDIDSETRTFYSHRWKKWFSSKFTEGYMDQQTFEKS